jgi:hypothetical protein
MEAIVSDTRAIFATLSLGFVYGRRNQILNVNLNDCTLSFALEHDGYRSP